MNALASDLTPLVLMAACVCVDSRVCVAASKILQNAHNYQQTTACLDKVEFPEEIGKNAFL